MISQHQWVEEEVNKSYFQAVVGEFLSLFART